MAWLLVQKPWNVPIPGTASLNRLAENIVALNIELTAEALNGIGTLVEKVGIDKERYPETIENKIDK